MFSHRGTAVITGVSSGPSLAYARRMAAQGYDLILVAADRDRLQTVARRITDVSGRLVEVLAGDLSRREDAERIERLLGADASITLVVNYRTHRALLPTALTRHVSAVIEVTGKAQCPLDDATWSLFLMQWERSGPLH